MSVSNQSDTMDNIHSVQKITSPEDALHEMCDELQHRIPSGNRRRLLRKYEDCFSGYEASKLLMSMGYAQTENDAICFCEELLSAGLMVCVHGDGSNRFKPSRRKFYRFTSRTGRVSGRKLTTPKYKRTDTPSSRQNAAYSGLTDSRRALSFSQYGSPYDDSRSTEHRSQSWKHATSSTPYHQVGTDSQTMKRTQRSRRSSIDDASSESPELNENGDVRSDWTIPRSERSEQTETHRLLSTLVAEHVSHESPSHLALSRFTHVADTSIPMSDSIARPISSTDTSTRPIPSSDSITHPSSLRQVKTTVSTPSPTENLSSKSNINPIVTILGQWLMVQLFGDGQANVNMHDMTVYTIVDITRIFLKCFAVGAGLIWACHHALAIVIPFIPGFLLPSSLSYSETYLGSLLQAVWSGLLILTVSILVAWYFLHTSSAFENVEQSKFKQNTPRVQHLSSLLQTTPKTTQQTLEKVRFAERNDSRNNSPKSVPVRGHHQVFSNATGWPMDLPPQAIDKLRQLPANERAAWIAKWHRLQRQKTKISEHEFSLQTSTEASQQLRQQASATVGTVSNVIGNSIRSIQQAIHSKSEPMNTSTPLRSPQLRSPQLHSPQREIQSSQEAEHSFANAMANARMNSSNDHSSPLRASLQSPNYISPVETNQPASITPIHTTE